MPEVGAEEEGQNGSELQEQLPEQNLAELEKGAGYGRW